MYTSSKQKREYVKEMNSYKQFFAIAMFSLVIFLMFVYSNKCLATKVCGLTLLDQLVRKEVTMTLPQATISVEVADTKESRELGLSGRSGIHDNQGMLFTFPVPGRYGFWMKDMNFPIDMVWINNQGLVVYVAENAKPEDYPARYVNDAAASYVLEIGSGKAKTYGLYLGSKVVMK
jgi:uncharacterized membrane protein (UPF0127 family)